MTFRFQKIRELGSKGKRSNPLLLEEFQWENEWVDINCDPALWAGVDEAVGATDQLRGRNMPREATARARNNVTRTYGRNKKRKTRSYAATESSAHEHEEEEDRVALEVEQAQGASGAETDEEMEEDQGGEEDSGGPAAADGNEEFNVDADLLL
jgi:hypothetical protein